MHKQNTAILVLHYGVHSLTHQCIKSIDIIKSNKESPIIFVIDNSDEQSFSLEKDLIHKRIEILRTGGNLGYAAGMNFGIKEALNRSATFIFLLNNDVILEKNCVGKLRDFLVKNINAGIVAPLIVHKDNPARIWSTGSKIHFLFGRTRDRFHNRKHKGFSAVEKVDAVTGCSMMVKAEVFKNIGFFDENYFAYYEDVDFCYRSGLFGYDIYFYPFSKVHHYIAASFKKKPNPRNIPDYFMVGNRLYFMKKYSGRSRLYFFYIIIYFEAVANFLKNIPRLRFKKFVAFLLGIHDAFTRESCRFKLPSQKGVSACIITKNAEKTIEKCLTNLQKVVDEIVIVDSGSRDKTLAICRRYTERIYETSFKRDFSELRNIAAKHSRNPWILALDADEYLSEDLCLKIQRLCQSEKYWGYYLKRINFYGDRIIKFGFPGIDSLIRLYRKEGSFFFGKVHEKVITQGRAKRTLFKIYHKPVLNNYTFLSFKNKWLKYLDIEADEKSAVAKRKKLLYLISAPFAFCVILCKDLFILFGFLDGSKGFKIAFLRALYKYKLFLKISKPK